MKVEELTGALLDQWVARALGLRVELRKHSLVPTPVMVLVDGNGSFIRGVPHYSSDWAQGGRIIEREMDTVYRNNNAGFIAVTNSGTKRIGPTLLVAAMRAYVSSKFGDEVPDEVPQ